MSIRSDSEPGQPEWDVISRERFLRAVGGAALALGGVDALLAPGGPAYAAGGQAKYLVLLTLDACRTDYLSLAPMNNLRSLMASGTTYDRAWVGQLASETPTGHATIGTGAFPRRHGILGFEWRDARTRKEVLDGWPPGVRAGLLDRDLRQSGTNSVSKTVKGADHSATVVAISSEKVYAADAMGGPDADHIFYSLHNSKHPAAIPQDLTGHRSIPSSFLNDPALHLPYPVKKFTQWDTLSAQLAVKAVEVLHPRVLMVNFPGADVYGHPYGGPGSPLVMGRIMKGVDKGIGMILAAYRQAGIFDQTLFLVVADHGMVPNSWTVSGDQVDHALLEVGAEPLFQTGGTAKYIYLRDPADAAAAAKHVARIPGVVAAYHLTASNGQYAYVDIDEGASRLDPALQAAHAYLLETFACARAPDVVGVFRENTIGMRVPTLYGYHGGLNWGAQQIPLVLSGPGVQSGQISHFPARLVDLAPTALALLGVRGSGMDGVVLADAMAAPSDADVVAQKALESPLTGYQDVLVAQAAANIAEDQAAGRKPPPRAPIHPFWVNTCCDHQEAS